jgi:hypothetical protein
MTSPDRLDPLSFAGSFAYLDSHVPPGMTLPAWRSQRSGANRQPRQLPRSTTGRADAGADLGAPGSHPAGARQGASAAPPARPRPRRNR